MELHHYTSYSFTPSWAVELGGGRGGNIFIRPLTTPHAWLEKFICIASVLLESIIVEL